LSAHYLTNGWEFVRDAGPARPPRFLLASETGLVFLSVFAIFDCVGACWFLPVAFAPPTDNIREGQLRLVGICLSPSSARTKTPVTVNGFHRRDGIPPPPFVLIPVLPRGLPHFGTWTPFSRPWSFWLPRWRPEFFLAQIGMFSYFGRETCATFAESPFLYFAFLFFFEDSGV